MKKFKVQGFIENSICTRYEVQVLNKDSKYVSIPGSPIGYKFNKKVEMPEDNTYGTLINLKSGCYIVEQHNGICKYTKVDSVKQLKTELITDAKLYYPKIKNIVNY